MYELTQFESKQDRVFLSKKIFILFIFGSLIPFNNSTMLQVRSEKITEEIKVSRSQNLQADVVFQKELQLQENFKQILLKTINIENFWRELIKLSQNRKNSIDLNVVRVVYELIKKGEPFEFLDGDDLNINKDFIQQLALEFNKNDEKILILSALGPQSSGKSTVLNRVFGCHFLTSVGRTTKGINLQLLNVRNKQLFNDQFDYILLLDTEGLQSPNQQDPEFDQKISLLVLAVSDIIFLIVKGDLHKAVKDLIETCIYTLSQIKESFSEVKQLIWCFNQNNDVQSKQLFSSQLQELIQNVKKAHEDENIDFPNILSNENIQVLGFATIDQRLCNQWIYYQNIDTFSQQALENFVDILKKFSTRIVNEGKGSLFGIKSFVSEITNIWESIQKLPDLLEFTELIGKQKNKIMHDELEVFWAREKENLSKSIQELNLRKQIEEWMRNSQNKNYREFYEQSNVSQRIYHIREVLNEKLLEIRDKYQISKKIYQKYLTYIERIINQEIMEYQFLIIDEIDIYQIQKLSPFFEKRTDEYVLSIAPAKLLELQNDPQQLDDVFEKLWKSIYQKNQVSFQNLYTDYEQNLIKIFKIEKKNFDLSSSDSSRDLNFFYTLLNQKDPNAEEKNQIYDGLQKQQVEKINGFMVIPKDQKYKPYLNIFHKEIREKIIFQGQSIALINISECFNICQKYILIQKENIQPYLSQYFLEDLVKLVSNQGIMYSEIYSFFSLLNMLKIEYKQKDLENLVQQVIKFQKQEVKKQQIIDCGELFIEGLTFNVNQRIVLQNEFFVNNFDLYYRSLNYEQVKLVNKDQFAQFLNIKPDTHVVIINDSLLRPRDELEQDQIYYKYITSPLNNKGQYQIFRSHFPTIFNKMMIKSQNGWRLLFSRVYVLIQSSYESDSKIKGKIQNIDQFKKITQKVEHEIKKFNEQFAFFGIILNEIGERYIKYSSLLILWRFFCQSKAKKLREDQHQSDEQLKLQIKEIFRAKISRNKIQQSTNQAQSLCNKFIKDIQNKYYEKNKQEVMKSLSEKMISSYEIIRQLDQQLLIECSHQQQQIIKYICNHKNYLNEHVKMMIEELIRQILAKHQMLLDKQIKEKFELIILKINSLAELLPNFVMVQDYFSNNTMYQESDYEHYLHEIVLNYFQGEQSQYLDLIKKEYQETFQERIQFKSVSIPLEPQQEQQETKDQISQLFPFLLELKKQCLLYSQFQKQAELNLENFEVQIQLDNLQNLMFGCQEVCPLCGRKCDQNNQLYFEHRHACRNGHQIRGMNKVLIQGKPSLYTCEEIEDDDFIVVQYTNIMIKWEDYKKNYREWDFQIYDKNEFQRNFIKMLNVWNGQIGKQICNSIQIQHEQKRLEQRKYYQQEENAHYILVIEDTTWINDLQWESLQLSTFQIMKKILKSEYSKLSVIQFNYEAKVVLDCDNVNYPFQLLIRDQYPQSNIELAFDKIIIQFQNNIDKGFDKIIVILHTKGLLSFPKKQIQILCDLPKNQKQQIIFRFYSLTEVDLELEKIVEILNKGQFDAELYLFQKTDCVQEIWAEKITSSKIFQF